jgi:hypothetical protein
MYERRQAGFRTVLRAVGAAHLMCAVPGHEPASLTGVTALTTGTQYAVDIPDSSHNGRSAVAALLFTAKSLPPRAPWNLRRKGSTIGNRTYGGTAASI